jgi:2-polyprenyl-6-methoxyphenol hydroxylase-like FAD-dependent oxidoreductase
MDADKKFVIIGASITGLALALSLRRLGHNVIIYEQNSTYYHNHHVILWKGAVQALLELGLGKRLSRIAWPIVRLTSTDLETGESIVDFPLPESPSHEKNMDLSYLPPMLGTRKHDLIRMLLTALAGRDDLVYGTELVVQPANNYSGAADPKTGIEADLATHNWFLDQDFESLVPFIKYGYRLESFAISATYGTVTLKFDNGHIDSAFMLVGCDGSESVVRSLLLNDRVKPQHTKQVLVQGVTNIKAPPSDSPTRTDFGSNFELLDRKSLLDICPDGCTNTYFEKGITLGISNLGNDLFGWNILAPQQTPGELADRFIMPKRRDELGKAVSEPFLVMPPVERRGSGGSAENWKVPSLTQSSEAGSMNSMEPNVAINSISIPSESIPASEQPSTEKLQAKVPSVPAFLPPAAFAAVGTRNLNGREARDFALLIADQAKFAKSLLSIIASTDVYETHAYDNEDLYGENFLKSFTSAQFHPGRVVLLGDAAHTVATAAHGSHGISLALQDVITLAKLVGFYFSSVGKSKVLSYASSIHTNDSLESITLDHISAELTRLRLHINNQAITDCHYEATWTKQKPGLLTSLIKYWNGSTWARGTYDQLQERGLTTMDPLLDWPKLDKAVSNSVP